MPRKSKGVNRLSIFIGVLFVMSWMVFVTIRTEGFSNLLARDSLVILLGTLITFIIGWSLVKALHWVYCGFKEDRESN